MTMQKQRANMIITLALIRLSKIIISQRKLIIASKEILQ